MLKGHVFIEGYIECITGLHIGSTVETIEIGGIDSPVVRNPITKEPYIPGSSLKGKMRSLLEEVEGLPHNRPGGEGILRHECDTRDDALKCYLCRPFGSTGKGDSGSNHPALLLVRDGSLKNKESLMKDNMPLLTEAKMENTLDRETAQAMPRTIERVPAGTEFTFSMVYRVNGEDNLSEDLKNILDILRLIEEKEGLGGNVSRGYGQVKFHIERFEGVKIDGTSAGGLEKAEPGKEHSFKKCREVINSIIFQ